MLTQKREVSSQPRSSTENYITSADNTVPSHLQWVALYILCIQWNIEFAYLYIYHSYSRIPPVQSSQLGCSTNTTTAPSYYLFTFFLLTKESESPRGSWKKKKGVTRRKKKHFKSGKESVLAFFHTLFIHKATLHLCLCLSRALSQLVADSGYSLLKLSRSNNINRKQNEKEAFSANSIQIIFPLLVLPLCNKYITIEVSNVRIGCVHIYCFTHTSLSQNHDGIMQPNKPADV